MEAPTSRWLTRSLAEHSGSATYAPAPTAPDQRQGLCLRLALPSAWAARLAAPAGLTQGKGMPGWCGRGDPIGSPLPQPPFLACARFVGQRAAGGPAKLT